MHSRLTSGSPDIIVFDKIYYSFIVGCCIHVQFQFDEQAKLLYLSSIITIYNVIYHV